MTGDYKEKYLRISADFAERAGRLDQITTSQKRLINRMAKSKQTEDVKTLLVSVAESVDASDALLRYTHQTLQGVSNDAKALCNGATLRNTIKWQSDLIEEFLDWKNDKIVHDIKDLLK